MVMAILIKSDHMVSVYLLLFKKGNHKYAILDHMTFLFIVKWPYENQHDHKSLKVTIKWPYDEFGDPYDSFMVIPHPQCMDTSVENAIKVHLNCGNVIEFEEVESGLYLMQKVTILVKTLVHILFSH